MRSKKNGLLRSLRGTYFDGALYGIALLTSFDVSSLSLNFLHAESKLSVW